MGLTGRAQIQGQQGDQGRARRDKETEETKGQKGRASLQSSGGAALSSAKHLFPKTIGVKRPALSWGCGGDVSPHISVCFVYFVVSKIPGSPAAKPLFPCSSVVSKHSCSFAIFVVSFLRGVPVKHVVIVLY